MRTCGLAAVAGLRGPLLLISDMIRYAPERSLAAAQKASAAGETMFLGTGESGEEWKGVTRE